MTRVSIPYRYGITLEKVYKECIREMKVKVFQFLIGTVLQYPSKEYIWKRQVVSIPYRYDITRR